MEESNLTVVCAICFYNCILFFIFSRMFSYEKNKIYRFFCIFFYTFTIIPQVFLFLLDYFNILTQFFSFEKEKILVLFSDLRIGKCNNRAKFLICAFTLQKQFETCSKCNHERTYICRPFLLLKIIQGQ